MKGDFYELFEKSRNYIIDCNTGNGNKLFMASVISNINGVLMGVVTIYGDCIRNYSDCISRKSKENYWL